MLRLSYPKGDITIMTKEKTKQPILDITFRSEIRQSQNRQTYSNYEQQKQDKTSNKKIWEYLSLATIPLVLVLGNSMLIPVLPQKKPYLFFCA